MSRFLLSIFFAPLLLLTAQNCPDLQANYASLPHSTKEKTAFFQKAATASPDCFQPWYLLARSNEELEQFGEAAKAYREAARAKHTTPRQIDFARAGADLADEKAMLLGQASRSIVVSRDIIIRSLKRKFDKDDPRAVLSRRATLHIGFDFDSATLSESGVAQVRELVAALKDASLMGQRFEVTGHTDNQGADGGVYNQRLSQRRADAVGAFLVRQGFSKDRMTLTGKGQTELAFRSNSDEANRANRRVEIRMVE